jgi:glycosyltransferase involved in cell wall biosynthesis
MSLATRLNSEFIHRLSVLIITFNEEANIDRALSALWWVPEILVVDSGSTDKTLSIISEYDNARVIYRKFDSFARQCNFGLENLDSEWVLSLDADYIVSSRLSEEISQKVLRPDDEDVSIHGFRIPFYYCIHGKPIRSGLLPPRTCLYRRTSAKYMDIGHGHRVIIDGKIVQLRNRIFHDDRKPIGVWLKSQQRYQQTEAYMLKSKTYSENIHFWLRLLLFSCALSLEEVFWTAGRALFMLFIALLQRACFTYIRMNIDDRINPGMEA